MNTDPMCFLGFEFYRLFLHIDINTLFDGILIKKMSKYFDFFIKMSYSFGLKISMFNFFKFCFREFFKIINQDD